MLINKMLQISAISRIIIEDDDMNDMIEYNCVRVI